MKIDKPTYGEELLGLKSHPDCTEIWAVKKKLSEAIDYVMANHHDDGSLIAEEAVKQLVTASMWSVKAVAMGKTIRHDH